MLFTGGRYSRGDIIHSDNVIAISLRAQSGLLSCSYSDSADTMTPKVLIVLVFVTIAGKLFSYMNLDSSSFYFLFSSNKKIEGALISNLFY